MSIQSSDSLIQSYKHKIRKAIERLQNATEPKDDGMLTPDQVEERLGHIRTLEADAATYEELTNFSSYEEFLKSKAQKV